MASGETLTDVNGTPMGTNTNPMFATLVENGVGENVKTSGTTLTGIDGNVQGTMANPLIVKIQDGTTPVDPNPMKVSGTTLTDIYGEPIGTNANPLILKALGGGGGGKKEQSGTSVSSSNTLSFQYVNGTSGASFYYLDGALTFKPSRIVITRSGSYMNFEVTVYNFDPNSSYPHTIIVCNNTSGTTSSATNYALKADVSNAVISSTSFRLPAFNATSTYNWTAYE